MRFRPRIRHRRAPSSWRRTAKRLGPPLFALRGAGAPKQGGFGWGSDRRYEAGIAQTGPRGEVSVRTSSHPRPHAAEWFLTTRWLHQALPPHGELTFPLELRADRWTADIVYSGTAYSCTFVGSEAGWEAEGEIAARAVEISGRGPTEGLELEAVSWRKVPSPR